MNNEHQADPKGARTKVTSEPSEPSTETLKLPRKFIVVAVPRRQEPKDSARTRREQSGTIGEKSDKAYLDNEVADPYVHESV
jgi:hypothetical protein